jgi:hypothetical protein
MLDIPTLTHKEYRSFFEQSITIDSQMGNRHSDKKIHSTCLARGSERTILLFLLRINRHKPKRCQPQEEKS